MDLKGQSDGYGWLAAGLHWVSALAILVMIPLGFTAAHTSDPAQATALLRLHLPLGVAILSLTIIRVIWWSFDSRPKTPRGQPLWQARLARGNHVLLYLMIFMLCGSGIGVVALSHAAPAIFASSTIRLPDFAAFKPMAVHVASAFALTALLVLHLSGVLYHQVVRRDHILARMRVGRPADAG